MKEQVPAAEDVPLTVFEEILQAYLGDDSATLTQLALDPLQHEGSGGAHLYRATVSWETRAGAGARTWIVKRWRSGEGNAQEMGVARPVEALAWQRGLLSAAVLPSGMAVPFVGALCDDSDANAWVVMDDVADALRAFSVPESQEQTLERAKFMLERLACWHVRWQEPSRYAELEECTWLLPQDRLLHFRSDYYAELLSGEPKADSAVVPGRFEFARASTLEFLSWMRGKDRALWERHLTDRSALIEALGCHEQTLLHGDLSWRNIGLRWSDKCRQVLLIDWEFIGTGTPALDVAKLVEVTLDFVGGIPETSESLVDYYFDCYVLHGGTGLSREAWEQAYDLAAAYHGLWRYPGLALRPDAALVAKTRAKAARIADSLQKWLPR